MSSRPTAITPLDAIGNTPVVKLRRVLTEGTADVYVKLESFNPTGSYKDRMALAMIEEAEKRGDLTAGMTVVEYTGGSTGSSLAFVCAAKGYRFKVVSSDAFAVEKLRTMEAFGAEVLIEPSEDGNITPDLVPRMIERARALAASSDHFWTISSTMSTWSPGTRGSPLSSMRNSKAISTPSAAASAPRAC